MPEEERALVPQGLQLPRPRHEIFPRSTCRRFYSRPATAAAKNRLDYLPWAKAHFHPSPLASTHKKSFLFGIQLTTTVTTKTAFSCAFLKMFSALSR